jgi:BolA protein
VSDNRQERLEKRLREALQPEAIQIKDQSHLHAGHAGAGDGRSHFAVKITTPAFDGQSRLQRHRLVYEAVGDMMETDIHALSITALTPAESQRS